MKRFIQSAFLAVSVALSAPALAASDYPTNELMGGEAFGHSVKHIGNDIYVFRWWVYRNFFIVTDEGVIATDPMNPKAASLLKEEIAFYNSKKIISNNLTRLILILYQ